MRFDDEGFSLSASAQSGHVLAERSIVCRQDPRGREEMILPTILLLHPRTIQHHKPIV